MDYQDEDVITLLNRLLEQLHQAGHAAHGSNIEIVYVAAGGQHINTQNNYYDRRQTALEAQPPMPTDNNTSDLDLIRHSIEQLMAELYGDEPLFNQQSHWQAVYRILVDRSYCRDSDFDGFDRFIRQVMPEAVNKPYRKSSVKQISQTDFDRPFDRWKYDAQATGTRKPFDRMQAVAQRFKDILEENGL